MTNREKCLTNLKGIINEFEHLYDKVKYGVRIGEKDFGESNKLLDEIIYLIKDVDSIGDEEYKPHV